MKILHESVWWLFLTIFKSKFELINLWKIFSSNAITFWIPTRGSTTFQLSVYCCPTVWATVGLLVDLLFSTVVANWTPVQPLISTPISSKLPTIREKVGNLFGWGWQLFRNSCQLLPRGLQAFLCLALTADVSWMSRVWPVVLIMRMGEIFTTIYPDN